MKKLTATQLNNFEVELQAKVYEMAAEYANAKQANTLPRLRQLKEYVFLGEESDWIQSGVVDFLIKQARPFESYDTTRNSFFESVGCGVGNYANRLLNNAFDVLILEATLNASN
jgi:hypothetical protein